MRCPVTRAWCLWQRSATLKNDYNLNLPRYIDISEAEDLQDIDGHLRGGIPSHNLDDLDRYWKVLPSVRPLLFESAGRPGYSRLKLPVSEVKTAIFDHPEFKAYVARVMGLFEGWKSANLPRMNALKRGDNPKAFIEALSESLISSFKTAELIDPYDLYQHLLNYWDEIMQDDAYLIVLNGWTEAIKPRLIVEAKGQKNKEEPDYTFGRNKYKTDLIPPSLLVARFFAKAQAKIESLEEEVAGFEAQLDELRDEHSGEGGLLEDVTDEKGKITKNALSARLKEIGKEKEFVDERRMLSQYGILLDILTDAKCRLRTAQIGMTVNVASKYPKLTEKEIKEIVVNDKWLGRISGDLEGELERVSGTLTNRIKELAERYETPLPQISKEVAALSGLVDEHLKKMGFKW